MIKHFVIIFIFVNTLFMSPLRSNVSNHTIYEKPDGGETNIGAHEGQLCEVTIRFNRVKEIYQQTCIQDGNSMSNCYLHRANKEPREYEHKCLLDSDSQEANAHTKSFFIDANLDPSFKSEFECAQHELDQTDKPCISNEVNKNCFSHEECCSGYCEPTSGITLENLRPGEVNFRIPMGTVGKCVEVPQDASIFWPPRPQGKERGESCENDNECMSKYCDESECKMATVCKRCTPDGYTPIYGSPCCGKSMQSAADGTCVAPTTFQSVSVMDVLGSGGAFSETYNNAQDSSSSQAIPFTSSDFYDQLEINVNERGNCSFRYKLYGQDYNPPSGSGSGNEAHPYNIIQDKIWSGINSREAILTLVEFLSGFKFPSADETAENILRPQDLFGIHDNLQAASLLLTQSRMDTHALMSLYQMEMQDLMDEIKSQKSSSQVDFLEVGEKSYSFMKKVLDYKKMAYERAALYFFGHDSDAEYLEINSNGQVVTKGYPQPRKYTYKKDHKQAKDEGGGFPSQHPHYNILTFLTSNRYAGIYDVSDSGCGLLAGGGNCKFGNTNPEEAFGESGWDEEYDGAQEGKIYSISGNWGSCSFEAFEHGGTAFSEHNGETWYAEVGGGNSGERHEENEYEEFDDHDYGGARTSDRFCTGSSLVNEEGQYKSINVKGFGVGHSVRKIGYNLNNAFTNSGESFVIANNTSGHSLLNTFPVYFFNLQKQAVTNKSEMRTNLKTNLKEWLKKPYRYTYGLRDMLKINDSLNAETKSKLGMLETDTNFWLSDSGNFLGYVGDDPTSLAENSILSDMLLSFTKSDNETVERLVYLLSGDGGRRYHSHTRPIEETLFFLALITSDLSKFYQKVSDAYVEVHNCFNKNNEEIEKELDRNKSTQGLDLSLSENLSIQEGGIEATQNLEITSPSKIKATGPVSKFNAFFNSSGITSVKALDKNDGTTSSNSSAESLANALGNAKKFVAGERKKKKEFLKHFKGSPKAAQELGTQELFKAITRAGLQSVQQAAIDSMAKGLGASSVRGVDFDGKKPLTKKEAALKKNQVNKRLLGAGRKAKSKKSLFGDFEAKGRKVKGKGKGVKDKLGLIKSVNKNKSKYKEDKKDDIWTKISKRYMLSLERILDSN